jgi:hypothetical protein
MQQADNSRQRWACIHTWASISQADTPILSGETPEKENTMAKLSFLLRVQTRPHGRRLYEATAFTFDGGVQHRTRAANHARPGRIAFAHG